MADIEVRAETYQGFKDYLALVTLVPNLKFATYLAAKQLNTSPASPGELFDYCLTSEGFDLEMRCEWATEFLRDKGTYETFDARLEAFLAFVEESADPQTLSEPIHALVTPPPPTPAPVPDPAPNDPIVTFEAAPPVSSAGGGELYTITLARELVHRAQGYLDGTVPLPGDPSSITTEVDLDPPLQLVYPLRGVNICVTLTRGENGLWVDAYMRNADGDILAEADNPPGVALFRTFEFEYENRRIYFAVARPPA